MAGDSLADALNRVSADPQAASPTPQKSWLRRTYDYVADTNLNSLSEALLRINPVTSLPLLAKDASEGKLIENLRTQLGSVSQVPTDVVAGVTALPGLAGLISGAVGGPSFGEGSLKTAADIRDWGKENIGEPIAGRELPEDLLRGTPADMAASWQRQLASAVIPLPIAKLSKFTTGVDKIDTAVNTAARTLEVLTPLAINPTSRTVAANVAVQGTLAPLLEAGVDAYLKGVQEKMDVARIEGETDMVDGAIDGRVVKPVQAGYSTGNDAADLAILGGIGAAGLFAGYRSNLVKRIADGWTRATTGYTPNLPEDASTLGWATKAKQDKLYNMEGQVESLTRAFKAGGYDTEGVERFAEQAAQRSGPGVNVRLGTFQTDGKFMDTAIKATPFNDFVTKVRMLGEEGSPMRKELAQVLHAAQELDIRKRLVNHALYGRTTTPGNVQRFNLYDHTTKELEDIVNAGMAKPEIKEVADTWYDYVRKFGEYTVAKRRFEPKEVSEFLTNNPRYVPPTGVKHGEFLNDRDIIKNNAPDARGLRTFEELGDPVNLMPRYVDEVFRSTEGKAIQRDWMLMMKHMAAQGNPVAKDMLGRDVKLSGEATSRMIKWRDQYGKNQFQEINDAVVRNSLRDVTNPTALQMSHGWASAFTRLFQSGAVGPLSIAQGTFFAPTSALYNATVGTVTRAPKGVAKGWLDRVVQDATGGKLSVPGDWLTLAPDAAVRAMANVGAVIAERGANALHNSVLKNGLLTKMASPAALESTSQAMRNWYQKTALYNMQEAGLMGPAGFNAVDRSLMYNVGKDVMTPPNPIKSGYRFIDDIMHAISVSPAMSIMAMNKKLMKNPDEAWKVSAAIRNMAGDPGRSGAFRNSPFQATAVTGTPWGNVFLQSSSAMYDSFKKQPIKTMTGIFNGTFMPAAAATMAVAALGPEYARYMFLERPIDKQASSIYIPNPNAPPDEGWEIPIDPLLRPFKAMAEAIVGAHYGLFSGELFKPENADMQEALKEMVQFRQDPFSPLTEGTISNAVAFQTFVPPVNPLIAGAGAAMGVNLRNYGDARVVQGNRQAGFTEGTSPDPSADTLFGHQMPAMIEDIVRAVGANGAAAIYNFFTGIDKDVRGDESQGVEPKSLAQALGYQGKEWKTRFADSTQALGSGALFGNFRALSPSSEAAARVVKQKLDTMKEIAEAYTATFDKNGEKMMFGNKRTGLETPLGRMNAAAQDPETAMFAQEVKMFYSKLQPTLQEIKTAYQQRQSLQADTRETPLMRRELMNQQSERIIDLNRRMLMDIQRFETVQSMRYGRKITLDSYDKGRSFLDQ